MANNHFRLRALLDLAYQLPCQGRLEGFCIGGRGEPAHSNQSRHGKGAMIKAHDCFFAALCRGCHRELDQGKSMSREEKAEFWQRAYEATVLALWRQELLQVAGGFH